VRYRVLVGGETREGVALVAQVEVVGVGGAAVAAAAEVARVDGHEARRLGDAIERPEQQRVDEAEDGRVGANPQRQRHGRHHREARLLQHHPHRVSHVLQQRSHQNPPSEVVSSEQ
jgi:hypothetical protein